MNMISAASAVTANATAGRVRNLLGHLAPSVFGAPYHVDIVLRGPDGRVKKHVRRYNTVTTAGKTGIAAQCAATPAVGKATHMAIGTGTPSGTALGSELDRNAFTSNTSSGAVTTMVANWAAGDGTGALTEAGTFDAASVGNMWMSASFSVVNKGASDTLAITWTLTFS